MTIADPKKAAEFLRQWLREEAGISMTKRETERVVERIARGGGEKKEGASFER